MPMQTEQQQLPPRKVWFKTYGCQMNYHDSERMMHHLSNVNFTKTEEQSEADLLVFNTCAVRDLANQKFYSHVGETKKLRNQKEKEVKIAISGCIAQTEGKELLKKYPQIDFTFGTDVIDNISEMVFRSFAGDDRFSINTWDKSSDYSIETKVTHDNPQAFINIMKGCDKFCSYCIVPFTRGREKSRKLLEVKKDIERLVEHSGVQEVMLLGQNVNSFGKENKENFADLIIALEDIKGLEIVRYTTSHPYDVTPEMISIHKYAKKLAPHLHLPVQSGSNTVLKRMLRQYSVEHYLNLIAQLKEANPHMVITSDIIAGFPNETEQEHQETAELLKNAKFDSIFSYAFSVRRGTKAARMQDVLTDDIRGKRLRELQLLQLQIQEQSRKDMVGKTYKVLVDGQSDMKGIKKWKGRTPCNRLVHFLPNADEQNLQWHWVDVKITNATALSCQGEFVFDYGKVAPNTSHDPRKA